MEGGLDQTMKVSCFQKSVMLAAAAYIIALFLAQRLVRVSLPAISASVPRSTRVDQNQTIVSSCSRYAFVGGPKAGLGHLISRIAIGYVYAFERNASLVLDSSHFHHGGKHGSYPWALEFLGLQSIQTLQELKPENLTIVREIFWHERSFDAPNCGVLFKTCDTCCSNLNRSYIQESSWCYFKKYWAFQSARPFFLRHFPGIDPTPKILEEVRERGSIDMVWHVRIGDLHLEDNTRREFVKRVMEQVHDLLNGRQIELYVLADGNIDSSYDFYHTFKHYRPQYLNIGVKEAFEIMIDCSLLVTSGSAFATVATLLKPKTRISLQSEPKEGTGVSDIFEHAILDKLGNIVHPSQSELRKRFLELP